MLAWSSAEKAENATARLKELRRRLEDTWEAWELVQLKGETEYAEIAEIDPFSGSILVEGGWCVYTKVILPGIGLIIFSV